MKERYTVTVFDKGHMCYIKGHVIRNSKMTFMVLRAINNVMPKNLQNENNFCI